MSAADDPTGPAEGAPAPRPRDAQPESRLAPAVTVVVAMVLPFLLPTRATPGPPLLLALVEGAFLVAVIAADPGGIDRRSALARGLSLALVGVLVLAAGISTVRLVLSLLDGTSDFASARDLLRTGAVVWVTTIAAFGFLYWELDGGGPANRFHVRPTAPDLAFPQHVNPDLAEPGWRPEFVDYLYVSFTTATAFSPTDTMPMTHWAKLTMTVQSVISITILSLVVANAVNLLQ